MVFSIILGFLPKKINYLWNNWGIELLVLANFAFQAILTVNGSRRRNTPGYKLSFSVWFSYLLAAKVATIVLGKLTAIDIGRTERNTHTELQALMAPLMFMQIGNPDTITAYSIEDNQLGVRQVFSMVIQVAVMFYIIVRSWTGSKTSFLYLSMALAGIIKYGETSWALKSALSGNFGFTVADFFKYHEAADLFNNLPEKEDELPEARLILRAYYRFCCLKPHLENWLYYPPTNCDTKWLYIDDCKYEDVFKITDSELGFMYDALYTKAPVTYTQTGFALRLISVASLIATICGFSVLFKDAFVYNISVGFIYYVLIASLCLEVYQILRLPFTDWAIIQMIRHCKTWRFLKYLSSQSRSWKRWSNTMGQFNMLDFCMQTKYRNCSRIWILQYFALDMKLRKTCSLERIDVPSNVKKLVVEELKKIEEIKKQEKFGERGKWTIQRYREEFKLEHRLIKQLETVSKRPFDKSIFIWHITTDIFYHRLNNLNNSDINAILNLSNYMMYLLVTRSHVLSTTTGDIIFDHSCVEIKNFIIGISNRKNVCLKLEKLSEDDINTAKKNSKKPQVTEAENAVVGKWSLLKDIKDLAQSLSRLSDENRWRLIGSMWVEMLGYAASNCEMEYHSEHIRQGGELITHVWLLIAHKVTKYTYEGDEEAPATSH